MISLVLMFNLKMLKKMKKKILFLVLFFAFIMQGSFAQKSENPKKVILKGFVKDKDNHPIIKATMVVPGSKRTKQTNKQGFYKMKIEPSTEKVMALTILNGYLEKEYNGEKNLDFVLPNVTDYNYSEDQKNKSKELIALGYNEDIVYENSNDAVIFNGRKINPHKYSSFEEMLDKEMSPNVKVVSRYGLYIVDGEYIQGVWNLKNIKPTEVSSIEIEDIGLTLPFYGIHGIYGVCKVKTKSSTAYNDTK